jgi:hypothetical protein
MDGMSLFAEREEPEEPQTSRATITVEAADDKANVTACKGAVSEITSTQRTHSPIILMSTNVKQRAYTVNFKF